MNDTIPLDDFLAQLPAKVTDMSREQLMVTLLSITEKLIEVNHEWRYRTSYSRSQKFPGVTNPHIRFLFSTITDYRALALFDDMDAFRCKKYGIRAAKGDHVYVIEFADGHIKIGYSVNPQKRVRTLGSSGPYTMRRFWISNPVKNASKLETLAHRHFKEHRVGGEFFTVAFDQTVEWIASQYANFSHSPEKVSQP